MAEEHSNPDDIQPPVFEKPTAESEPYNIKIPCEWAGDGFTPSKYETVSLAQVQIDEIFERRFREICRAIPVNALRWIDPLCAVAAKDADGIIPGVIDMQSASKSELARCADLCKRLESIFSEIAETAKTNRAHACKWIGAYLEENEEGDFVLTDSKGQQRARFLRSSEFHINVQDDARMLGWLFTNGFGGIVQSFYYNPLKLKSVIQDWVKAGEALPDNSIVKCHKDPLAKITKTYDIEGVWDGAIEIQKPVEVVDFTKDTPQNSGTFGE